MKKLFIVGAIVLTLCVLMQTLKTGHDVGAKLNAREAMAQSIN